MQMVSSEGIHCMMFPTIVGEPNLILPRGLHVWHVFHTHTHARTHTHTDTHTHRDARMHAQTHSHTHTHTHTLEV